MSAAARRRQAGFLVIAAVFLVVVLAGLVAYLMTATTTTQAASAADLNSARAYQAARAGIEWGAYQIRINPGGAFATSTCTGGAPTQVDITVSAFTTRVTCTSSTLSEGGAPVTAYRIVATACNEPACPNTATTSATYVERQISLTITSN